MATSFVRPHALVWALLFAALVLFSPAPDRSPTMIAVLVCMGLFQMVEPSVAYLSTQRGAILSFAVKLLLCVLLLGWTDGIASSYYWLLLLPVVSAATSFGAGGTLAAAIVACGAYLMFWLRLPQQFYVPPDQQKELALRVIGLPMVGYLTHQLAEAKRAEAQRYQRAAQELAESNEKLSRAEAAANRSERLAALGQLSAGLAHELRNPLGTMKTSAEMLLKTVPADNEVAHEMASFISTEVDRTNSLITRFLDFARPLALRPEEGDIGQVIDLAVTEIERHRPPFDIAIYKNYSPDIRPFRFDPELMQRVFFNLLLNAAQASPPKSSITVKTRAIDGMVEIDVIDRGSGIAPKHLESIFNPFFTTKSKGTGLGLAIVSKIVDEHGGKVAVESDPNTGTIFRVYLPKA